MFLYCIIFSFQSPDDDEEYDRVDAAPDEGEDATLQPEDELTLAELKDLEEELDRDIYTSESCCRSLAKVSSQVF